MFKIPYVTKFESKIDFKEFNKSLFEFEQNKVTFLETDDICDYFKMMNIPYSKEVILGAYPIDIYIPNLPEPNQIEQMTATNKE